MTALKAHEVEKYLANPDLPAGLYLIYGPDAGLVRQVSRRLITHFAGKDPDPLAHSTFDAKELEEDPSRLAMEAKTPSLFGGKRTIRVRGVAKSLTANLTALLNDIPDAVICVEADNLKPADALRKLAESSKQARALPCYADNERALGDLIRKSFSDAQINHPPEVINSLRDLLGNDREISRQEIDKLILYAWESKSLTVEDVQNLCGDNSTQAIDAIIDAVASGHATKFDEAFQSARNSGADSQRILAVSMLHFSSLRRMRVKVDTGVSPKDVLNGSRPRPHFSRMASMERQLRLWTDKALSSTCNRLYTAVLESRKNSVLSTQITQRALLAVCIAGAQR